MIPRIYFAKLAQSPPCQAVGTSSLENCLHGPIRNMLGYAGKERGGSGGSGGSRWNDPSKTEGARDSLPWLQRERESREAKERDGLFHGALLWNDPSIGPNKRAKTERQLLPQLGAKERDGSFHRHG